jgi:ribulose 1,5-bisphosphate synthetase/thiazole synthase
VTAAGSPWLAELERNRDVRALGEDTDADAVIIGGGISGIATAYQLLQGTDLDVAVLEAGLGDRKSGV